jgi:transposase
MGRQTLPMLLTSSEKQMLEYAWKKHGNWRVRERAQTLLLLSQGWSCEVVAEYQGLCAATVRSTRRIWLEERFEGLADKPRCGAPHKLTESD